MWKKEEPARPSSVTPSSITTSSVTTSTEAPAPAPLMSPGSFDQRREEPRPMHEEAASIGKSIIINGELSGSEDLTIEGRVDGKIELRNHVLTIGVNGRITAQVTAKAIVVFGHVTGNLTATEKVDIRESGSVEGDIVAPRVAIADGSHFRGSIDMQRKEAPILRDSMVMAPEPESRSSMAGELVRV